MANLFDAALQFTEDEEVGAGVVTLYCDVWHSDIVYVLERMCTTNGLRRPSRLKLGIWIPDLLYVASIASRY